MGHEHQCPQPGPDPEGGMCGNCSLVLPSGTEGSPCGGPSATLVVGGSTLGASDVHPALGSLCQLQRQVTPGEHGLQVPNAAAVAAKPSSPRGP